MSDAPGRPLVRAALLAGALAAGASVSARSGEPVRLGEMPDAATSTVIGTIRGRIELRQPPADRSRRPNVGDLGMPPSHDPTDRRRSVVYLDPAPRAAFDSRDEPHATMDQRNESFVPHVLAIVAGTTVDFPNSDRIYHNVFSLSRTKSFDLGRY